jgi:transcription elongation GreA/GreB family factor
VLGARIGDTVSYALANGKQVTVEIIAAQPYAG